MEEYLSFSNGGATNKNQVKLTKEWLEPRMKIFLEDTGRNFCLPGDTRSVWIKKATQEDVSFLEKAVENFNLTNTPEISVRVKVEREYKEKWISGVGHSFGWTGFFDAWAYQEIPERRR